MRWNALLIAIFAPTIVSAGVNAQPSNDTSNDSGSPHFELNAEHQHFTAPELPSSRLRGSADQSRVKLEAKSNVLRGGATQEQEGATLRTRQRKFKVSPSLKPLQPLIVPSRSRQPQSQINRSTPILDAELGRAKREMEAELSRARQRPQVYAIPRNRIPIRRNTPLLDAEISKAKSQMEAELARQQRQAEEDLSRIRPLMDAVRTRPVIERIPTRREPLVDAELIRARQQMEAELARTKPHFDVELERAKRQMEADIARTKPLIDAELVKARRQMEAELALARSMRKKQVNRARPELSALRTQIRLTPQPAKPIIRTPTARAQGSSKMVISWDEWWIRFKEISNPRLIKALRSHGYPAGSNSVSITVWPGHRLQAKVIQGSNSEFDTATVEGYNSLDGNPALEFPAGSTRTKVTFQLDNEQDLTGPIGKVDSKTVTGDTETQYSHW